MSKVFIEWNKAEMSELLDVLGRKSAEDLHEVEQRTALDLYTRSQQAGGTPVGNYTGGGQMRIRAAYDDDEMGYTVDYAPHVEYGHRQQVGRFVPAIGKRLVNAFVPGQYFLKDNVEKQKPITRQYIIDKLNE